MPKCRRDKWINRTNQPGTCFYCGQKKTPSTHFYGDFCSLTCCHWFAQAMVNNGNTLIIWRGDPHAENQEKGD